MPYCQCPTCGQLYHIKLATEAVAEWNRIHAGHLNDPPKYLCFKCWVAAGEPENHFPKLSTTPPLSTSGGFADSHIPRATNENPYKAPKELGYEREPTSAMNGWLDLAKLVATALLIFLAVLLWVIIFSQPPAFKG